MSWRDYENYLAQKKASENLKTANTNFSNALSRSQSLANKPTGTLADAIGGVINNIGTKVIDAKDTGINIAKTIGGGINQLFTNNDLSSANKADSQRRNDIAKKYGYDSYSQAVNSNNASQDFWNEIKNSGDTLRSDIDKSRNEGKLFDVTNVNTNKAKGQALNTIGTVLDFVPGAKPITAVAGSSIEGIGDAYKEASERGSNADVSWKQAGNNALIGSLSSLAGMGVGRGIGNIAGDNALAKIAKSNLGASTIAGAGAGATGALANYTLNTPDWNLSDAVNSTLSGAKTGAISGGTMAGLQGVGNKLINNVNNKLSGVNQTTNQPEIETAKTVTEVAEPTNKVVNNDYETEIKKQRLENKIQDSKNKIADNIRSQYGTVRLNDNLDIDNAINYMSERGLSTKAEIDNFTNKVTGSDGVMSKIIRRTMQESGNVPKKLNISMEQDVFAPAGAMGDTSARAKIQSYFDSQSAKFTVNPDGTMSRSDMYDLGRKLQSEGYTQTAKGERTQNPTTVAYGDGLKILADKLIEQSTDGVSVKLNDTDIKNLRNILPNSDKWQSDIDNFINSNGSIAEARNFMANATKMSLYKKASDRNRGTYGQNVGDNAKKFSKSQILDTALNAVGKTEQSRKIKDTKYRKEIAKSEAELAKLNGQTPTNATSSPLSAVLNLRGLAGKALDAGKSAVDTTSNAVKGAYDTLNTQGVLSGGNIGQSLMNLNNARIGRDSAMFTANKAEQQQANDDLQNAQMLLDQAQSDYDNTSAQLNNNGLGNALAQSEQQLTTLNNAMQYALSTGDIQTYQTLAGLYGQAQDIYNQQAKMYEAQNPTASTDKLTDSQKKALAAKQQLETLSGMNSDLGTLLAQSGGVGSGIVNLFGGNDYANQAQSLASTIGYLQSGANVSKGEMENIKKSYIPNATDSEAVKKAKIARAQELLNSYLQGTSYGA